MTAAVVGVFLLYHFDANWGWYVAVIAMGLIEGYHHDNARDRILHSISRLAELIPRQNQPYDED